MTPGPSAAARMARLCGGFVAVCFALYMVLLVPMIAGETPHSPVWTVGALALENVAAVGIVVSLIRRDDRGLSACSLAFGGAYLLAAALWRPMWDGSSFTGGDWQWHSAYLSLMPISVAPYVSRRAVWAWFAVTVVVVQASTVGFTHVPFTPRLLSSVVTVGIAVAVPVTLLDLARRRDAERAETRRQVMAAAAAEAAAAERERVHGLVHDSVMSTLLVASAPVSLAAAPGGASDRRVVVEAARRTLDDLAAMRALDTHGPAPMTGEAFVARVRSGVHAADPCLAVTATVAPGAVELPGEAAIALVDAATEAVRNVVRHAPDSTRTCTVRVDAEGAGVEVADTGPGFRPDRVPETRMGVRASIVERVRQVLHRDDPTEAVQPD